MDSTIAAAVLGGLLAVGGGVAGQWLSGRSADDRDRRAAEHESRKWARDQRCSAYLGFMLAYRDLSDDVMISRRAGLPGPGPEGFSKLLESMASLELLGSTDATLIAQALCADLNEYSADLHVTSETTNFADLLDAFRDEVRQDLGIAS